MGEQRPGVIPPRSGRPPRTPNSRQVAFRRALALCVLVLILGGLGWLAVAAIGGGDNSVGTKQSTLSNLVYRTVTRTTATGTVETVLAMPKPFHVVFPEGFTRKEMAQRVAAVAKIADHKRKITVHLSSAGYVAATRSAICFRVKPSGKTTWNGFGIAITVSTVPVAVVRVTVR